MNYADLNLRADVLAEELRKGGLRSEDVVGIQLERSIEMLVAVSVFSRRGDAGQLGGVVITVLG